MEDQFDGDGFKEEPIEGKEAAQHRHMFYILNKNWVQLDQSTIDAMKDGGTIIQFFRIASSIIKVGGPVVLAAALGGAWLRSQGLI